MSYFRKAICNDPFENWEIADVFRYAGELGYDGVELNPYTLGERIEKISPRRRSDIREAAESAGVEIIGLHGVFKTMSDFYYLNHPEASVRAKTIEHLSDFITLCGDLGGKIIVLGASKHRDVYPELTYQQAWDYAVEAFEKNLEVAEEYEVTLCLEPLSHRLTNFITEASEAIRMVKEIGHHNFRMMLDVRSASDDEIPIPDLITMSALYLAHFHANDDNGRGPGAGNADYFSIASALRRINYSGYLSVEVFDFRPDPETIARESLDVLKQHFGSTP